MTYEGMDADVVQRVGTQLQRVGGDLGKLAGQVDVLVRQMVQHWDGPAAQTFAHNWNSGLRGQAVRAAEAVTGLGQAAVNNADEQRRASNGSAGSNELRFSTGAVEQGVDWMEEAESDVDAAGHTLEGLVHELSRFAPRGPDGRFVAISDDPVLTLLQRLEHDNYVPRPGMSSAVSWLEGGAKVLGVVGAGLGLVTSGWEQYEHDGQDPSITEPERVSRAVVKGGSVALGSVIGGDVGAALGTLIPVPVVGTVVGGLIGSAIGGWIGGQVGDGAIAAATSVGESVADIGWKASQAVGDVAKASINTVASVAEEAGRGLANFFDPHNFWR